MAIVITLAIDRLRTVEFSGSTAEREIEIHLWPHLLPLVDRIDAKLRHIHAKVQRELKHDERAEAER
jgi:hypothetical protein